MQQMNQKHIFYSLIGDLCDSGGNLVTSGCL